MESTSEQENIADLKERVRGFLDYSWRKHRVNYWLNVTVVLASLALSAALSVVSALGYSLCAATMGAGLTFLLGIQNAFKFAEFSHIWEQKHLEAKSIRDRLNYRVPSQEQFQKVLDSWLALRSDLAKKKPAPDGVKVPRGK